MVTVGAEQLEDDVDPIVAALPPATDYLTYLTLLEYQLTPSNLSTLNRLLSEDNGTLVSEIGWDLLRIVLPMHSQSSKDVSDCVQIIARRGNPREVVVRVAEELEKLGKADMEDEDDENEDEDDLPTFDGEATRIHLGQMKLDGMPESDLVESTEASNETEGQKPTTNDQSTDLELTIFEILLSTLSIIHPRIKTKYPSRFLATSLPAALGAYRRLPITVSSSRVFLCCLRNLSGKWRPPLPPRHSTNGNINLSEQHGKASSTAGLPDPEAETEAETGTNVASEIEQTITNRLLQAVLLEVLDEYLSSLRHDEVACMQWTSRLREEVEPKRVVPGKQTARGRWTSDPQLQQRSALMEEITSLASHLNLRSLAELRVVTGQDKSAFDEDDDPEVVSEYPTSPAQVPFPTTGLLELLGAESFACQRVDGVAHLKDLNYFRLIQLIQPISAAPELPNVAVQDGLCSLLYQITVSQNSWFANQLTSIDFQMLIAMLTQTFVITPDAATRDNTHHIASRMIAERSSSADRLEVVKQTIRCTFRSEKGNIALCPSYSEGILKAIGVDWLKDDIVANIKRNKPGEDHPNSNPAGALNVEDLGTDQDFKPLIFPEISKLNPTVQVDPETTTAVLLALPYYISILNLLCVVLSTESGAQLPETVKASTLLLSNLEGWKHFLLEQMSQDDDVKESFSDIFAFEDSCTRAREALGRTAQRHGSTAE